MNYERQFWQKTEEYHDLVEQFEQSIEIVHPGFVTGRTGCPYCHKCRWETTKVVYYEHRGERIA